MNFLITHMCNLFWTD